MLLIAWEYHSQWCHGSSLDGLIFCISSFSKSHCGRPKSPYMPNSFKQQYPSTGVIIDATAVFIQQPSLPELQQRTYYSYKNHNTYKGLVGISPSGAVTFVSKLYPGSISNKELTRQSTAEWFTQSATAW